MDDSEPASQTQIIVLDDYDSEKIVWKDLDDIQIHELIEMNESWDSNSR